MEGLRLRNNDLGDFPGGSVVKTSPSNVLGAGLIPGGGAKIPHASRAPPTTKKSKHKAEVML